MREPVAGIYFVQDGQHPLVKIGYASDVRRRIASLQTANPNRLNVAGVMVGFSMEGERQLHGHFEKDRIRGEWFRFSADLREYIDKHSTPLAAAEFFAAWEKYCEPIVRKASAEEVEEIKARLMERLSQFNCFLDLWNRADETARARIRIFVTEGE